MNLKFFPVLTSVWFSSSIAFCQLPRVDITDYGADRTGVTNIYSAFTNAITVLKSHNGGTLLFPKGTYNIATATEILGLTNVVIRGEGMNVSVIVSTFNGSPSQAAAFKFSNATNVTFRDFTIRGKGVTDTTGAYELINFSNISGISTNGNIRFENVEFRWARHAGLREVSSTVTKDFYLVNCWFRDIGTTDQSTVAGGGFESREIENLVIDNCTFENIGNARYFWAIYATRNHGGKIVNCHFKGYPTGPSPVALGGLNLVLSLNTFTGDPAVQTRSVFNDVANFSVTGNSLTNARFNFRDAADVNISGNVFSQPANAGSSLIELDQDIERVTIVNNNFHAESLAVPSLNAIRNLDDAGGAVNQVLIMGNTCHNIGLATIERGTNHWIGFNRVHAPGFTSKGHGAIRIVDSADGTTEVWYNEIFVAASALAINAEAGSFANVIGNNVKQGVLNSSVTPLNAIGKYRSRFPPSATQTLAADHAISANATIVRVGGSGGAVTLARIPTIADGTNGDYLVIMGATANSVTLQDEGTLAGSNLELGAATRTIGQRDVLTLIFSSDASAWIEVSFANN